MRSLSLLLAVAAFATALPASAEAPAHASSFEEISAIRPEQLPTSAPVIIHDGKNWTMVPAGSFIQLPDCQRHRLSTKPLGNLVSWKSFLRLNQDWLKAEDVSLRQVNGRATLDERRLRYLARQPQVVIAIHEQEPAALTPADTPVALSDRR
ncbi:MAG: hypothetical protein MUF31_12865 [Akkermansiaceae bacterium]|jgi:hypothetical protein|nr:hypothetical protein [Akkermansiaceae bacterium]